jgi:hypothetical protein
VGCGVLRGPGLDNACVVGRVVLLACFYLPSFAGQRGLRFAPLCVARDLGWCDHEYPRCDDAHNATQRTVTSRVLGSPASLIGSELPRWLRYGALTLRSAPVLCRYNRRTSSREEGKGLGIRREAPALYCALPRPDALSPLPAASPCAVSCVRVHQHVIPDDRSIPRRRSWPYRGGAMLPLSSLGACGPSP